MSEEPKGGNLQNINEDLYKQNVELAIKNKTLSLLGKLYQFSVLSLEPVDLAKQITATVRELLNFEFVTLFHHDKPRKALFILASAPSNRFLEAEIKAGKNLADFTPLTLETNPFLHSVIIGQKSKTGAALGDIWGSAVDKNTIEKITEVSHLRNVVIFPLIENQETIGALAIGINRADDTLSSFEKESLWNISNICTVALDKAFLYDELRIANEKLKSLDKLKTEFVSLASHQLRSPLTAIKGYSSMLLEGSYGEVPAEEKVAVERIFQSSQNLSKVIEDLLSVSKIEQGGMKYEFSQIDFTKMAHDLVQELSVSAKNKGLELTFESDLPSYSVMADPVKLRQVVINLIDNSIKYTPHGFVKVEVTKGDDPKKIWMKVTDSGIGMSAETKEKLFGKFARGEGQKVNAGGSGLGLYLAKEIVEAHKGRLWAESPGVDKGATFFLELDLVNED